MNSRIYYCKIISDLTESGVDNESEYEEMPLRQQHHHNTKTIRNNNNNNNNSKSSGDGADHGCSACVTVISVCPSPARQTIL
jgi:hypothetical protein